MDKKVMESPFVYHKELQLFLDNKGKEIKQGGFLAMESNGVINENDRKIIIYLLKAGYATRKNINMGLNCEKDCIKSLEKLVRNNVINKYHYAYEDENGVKHKTVDFYGLGNAARKISTLGVKNSINQTIKKMGRTSVNYEPLLDVPVKVLRLLELNMMDASLMRDYSGYFSKVYENFIFKGRGSSYRQQFMYLVTKKDNDNSITSSSMIIIPVCARRNAGWRRELFSVLSFIKECISKDNIFRNVTPVFIVNTEDNLMACEAEIGRNGYPVLNDAAVFYISDWSVCNSMVLDNLIYVVEPKKENYDIMSLKMDI